MSISSTLLIIGCVLSLSVHIMTCPEDRLRLPLPFPRALGVILIRLRLWAEFRDQASVHFWDPNLLMPPTLAPPTYRDPSSTPIPISPLPFSLVPEDVHVSATGERSEA
ncbi:hypothetical protein V8D89_000940 [Ganoderma adspersum]